MRLGAAVEWLHHGAREQLDLLAGGVVQLRLPLERLDRGLHVTLARHHRQGIGDRLPRFPGREPVKVGGEPLVDRLDALEPEQAGRPRAR